MAIETATYINDLVITNPTASDPKSQGDDHLRLVKSILKNTFAGFAGMVLVTGTEAQGATVNDYTVTLSPAPIAYTAFQVVLFKSTHVNTGATTLQIGALGTRSLVTLSGQPLAAGDIELGAMVLAYYDGTSFYLISTNDRVNRNTGNASNLALSGTPTAPTAALGTSTTQIATTQFVATIAFNTALPAQTGNAGKYVTTNGTTASWVDIIAPTIPAGAIIYTANNFGGF